MLLMSSIECRLYALSRITSYDLLEREMWDFERKKEKLREAQVKDWSIETVY
jgi:hypothetical protein